jgi:D-amino-acid dehydrogenase
VGDESRSAVGRGPDVAVIGTGIVGACCAAQLALEGCSVTFVEANEPGGGASFGNAGALSPSSCIPLSLPGVLRKVPSWLLSAHGPLVVRPSYALRALPWLAKFVAAGGLAKVEAIADALRALHGPTHECYRPLLQAAGATALVRQSGALVVYGSVKSFRATLLHWEMRRERGAKFEILDGPAIRELVPALATTFERAVLQPDHGYVDNPKALVIKLVELVLSRGGRMVHGRAAGIVEAGDKLAVTLESGQSVSADHVVIAAGAWSGELMRRLRLSIPLETQRGYHLHLVRPSVVLNQIFKQSYFCIESGSGLW